VLLAVGKGWVGTQREEGTTRSSRSNGPLDSLSNLFHTNLAGGGEKEGCGLTFGRGDRMGRNWLDDHKLAVALAPGFVEGEEKRLGSKAVHTIREEHYRSDWEVLKGVGRKAPFSRK